MRFLLILFISNYLMGCGSISTIPQSDFNISRQLTKAKTKCDELPRIYSGVAYDICTVHSAKTDIVEVAFYGYFLFDTLPSLVIDTVALPYTIYQQVDVGNVKIKKASNSAF